MCMDRAHESDRVTEIGTEKQLQSTAHVEGNLVHKTLAVEHGTHFEGESRPSENPLASNPEVPGVEPQLNHDGHSEIIY
jgi:cytoskeletal protein CcmA (bactofilin family)